MLNHSITLHPYSGTPVTITGDMKCPITPLRNPFSERVSSYYNTFTFSHISLPHNSHQKCWAFFRNTPPLLNRGNANHERSIAKMNSKFFQTSPHTENGYAHNPLSTTLFVSALDTRMNYLPRNPRYKHNKYTKRKFKIKPYNSMVFKDIPFNLHIIED